MNISDEQLNEFKEIYSQEFNISLTDKEAEVKAANLITLMKVILKHKQEMAQKKVA